MQYSKRTINKTQVGRNCSTFHSCMRVQLLFSIFLRVFSCWIALPRDTRIMAPSTNLFNRKLHHFDLLQICCTACCATCSTTNRSDGYLDLRTVNIRMCGRMKVIVKVQVPAPFRSFSLLSRHHPSVFLSLLLPACPPA